MTRSAEAPPPEGLAPSPANLMPEQSTPLSGMTGVAVDIKDVRENEQVNAGYDPKSCPIQSEKIPITTIYRPDLMPDRVEGSIAPVVEYDMVSVPVSLSKFDVPGLNTEVVTLSTAVWWQPRACPRAIASASSLAADWERLLLTNSSVFEWRLIRCLPMQRSHSSARKHTMLARRFWTRMTRSERTADPPDQLAEMMSCAAGLLQIKHALFPRARFLMGRWLTW